MPKDYTNGDDWGGMAIYWIDFADARGAYFPAYSFGNSFFNAYSLGRSLMTM